ncbi:MAG: YfdX family protein [Candidatus Thiodiazotropha sp.]
MTRMTPNTNQHKPSRLAIALMLALTLGSAPILAATSGAAPATGQEQLQQDTTHYMGWTDPVIAQKVARSGQALIDVLERADQALVANDGEAVLAQHNLDYAQQIAQGIERQMPYVVMKDKLLNAKGQLEDGATHDFLQTLAPVYSSIDNLAMISPRMAGSLRTGVQQAANLAKAGDGKQAAKQIDDVVDQLTLPRVYLPIITVNQQIGLAQKALAKQDMSGARTAIEQALGSILIVQTGTVSTGTLNAESTGS